MTDSAGGWQGLSLWRKAIYVVIAMLIGAIPGVIVGGIGSIILPILGGIIGLAVWIAASWYVSTWIRDDIDYIDSDEYSQRHGDSVGSRHWP